MPLVTIIWFTHTHIRIRLGADSCPLARSGVLLVGRRYRPYPLHRCERHEPPYMTVCYTITHRIQYNSEHVNVPNVIVHPPPPCNLNVPQQ